MHRVIVVDLTGHSRQFRLHEDAYGALRGYLDQARARLGTDPDAAEVIGDLEGSIGERLAVVAGPTDRVIDAAAVAAVLEEVGAVEVAGGGGSGAPTPPSMSWAPTTDVVRPVRRRLYRIREGQNVAGVCTGLAAYSDLDVSMVRLIFVGLAIFTAGIFILVYLALMFILPVLPTRAAWFAAVAGAEGPPAT